MAIDTTALATAIAAMRAAVAAGDVANEPRQLSQAAMNEVRVTVFAEADAGRALLAALKGVPERLAALEVVAGAAREIPITWRLDAVKAALAALDASRKGAGGGTD